MELVNDEDLPAVKFDDQAEHDKYSIPVLDKSKYVREIDNHDAIHIWDDRFGERGDLVENYEPSLKERINLGEDLAELNSEGFTYKQLSDAGATDADLKAYGVTGSINRKRK